MENTLIIINAIGNTPISNGLTDRENKMLSTAGLLDIITEASRLAECNPEMKVIFYDSAPNKESFWRFFTDSLQNIGLQTDRHLTKYFEKKVHFEQIKNENYTQTIKNALEKESLDDETENIVLINGSCPMLIGEILDDAFYYMNESHIVIGGAKKSDLYLLGMHEIFPRFFEKFCWDSGNSYDETAKIAENLDLDIVKLDVLDNIYNYQSLEKLYEKISQNGFAPNTKTILQRIIDKQ